MEKNPDLRPTIQEIMLMPSFQEQAKLLKINLPLAVTQK